MDVLCPRCGARIVSEDIKLDTMVAKCRACHAVFGFSKQVASTPAHGQEPPPALERLRRHSVPMPPGLSIESAAEGRAMPSAHYRQTGAAPPQPVVITRRWFQMAKLGLLPFAIAWNAFLVVWYGALSSFSGGGAPDAFMLIFWVFPLGHVAVGLRMAHQAVANLVNRTTVAVSDDQLVVKHGPIPARGNQALDAREVTQLYAVKEGAGYEVHVALADGSSMPLVKGLPELSQALFIEQQLERALGLDDVHMPGEVEQDG